MDQFNNSDLKYGEEKEKHIQNKIKEILKRNGITPPLSGPQATDLDRAQAKLEIQEEDSNTYSTGFWGQKALAEATRIGKTGNKPVTKINDDPSSMELTYNWVTGRGLNHHEFDGNSQHTKNMQDAWRVNEARKYYYKNKDPHSLIPSEKNYTNVKGSFGLPGLVRAGFDPTEQFVGSYRIDIKPRMDDQNKTWLDYELNNNSSFKSFLYGFGPDWERDSFRPFGNMRQTYQWSEPYNPYYYKNR